ncbi:MAG: sugar phosphate isomerase/epimerase [Candidatus Hydrogenedentes bacterium]|nr:sugar phosphate isomerase/epimerase [Candidatus Hydrogenedentota bacterium]
MMGKLHYALQLYTVRDYLEKDVAAGLQKVREAGYGHVEVGGTHGLTEVEFKKQLDNARLRPISMHTGYDDVVGNTPKVIEMANIFGIKYVAIGGIDPKLTPDKAGWQACGQALDAAGARLRAAGIILNYHNHSHEFNRIGEEYPFDILMAAARPENLAAQIDTFWVRYAGLSPAGLIARYSGRCPLLHVKDMLDIKSRAFTEMGNGIIDWREVFDAAAAAGTKWFIVEQDVCAQDSIASAAISAQFMSRH